MSVDKIDDEIEVHICDFPRCDFVTINNLDANHIYCLSCLGEPVHFNAHHPKWKMGRCLKCGMTHIEWYDGKLEYYRVDSHTRIIGSTYGCSLADTTPRKTHGI